MGLTDRSSEAIGGPRGGTAWFDCGDSFTLAGNGTNGHTSFTVTTTLPGNIAAQTVTRPNSFYLNYNQPLAYQDFLDSTQLIQTLYGFQVTASAAMGAQTTLNLSMSVYRTVGTLSGAGGAATTSVPLTNPLTQAIPSGSTLTITKVDSSGTSASLTTSAVANAGATSIPITSANLTGYATLSNISWQVGNNPAFGWLASGTGTPAFPLGVSVVTPIIAANTSLITSGVIPWPAPNGTTTAQTGCLPMQFGDGIVVTCTASSGTVTCQVLNIQPLMT
jgi:hypothetical protein